MLVMLTINFVVVTLSVIVHYEFLRLLSVHLPKIRIRTRLKVVFGILGSLAAHIIEVWIFAAAYYGLIQLGTFGNLEGNFTHSILDCAYYSITTYTSLGTGDIQPTGDIRFLAGIEALCGLVLITWSASFMFIEMQKYWKTDDNV